MAGTGGELRRGRSVPSLLELYFFPWWECQERRSGGGNWGRMGSFDGHGQWDGKLLVDGEQGNGSF